VKGVLGSEMIVIPSVPVQDQKQVGDIPDIQLVIKKATARETQVGSLR